jgi:hypothetical protein
MRLARFFEFDFPFSPLCGSSEWLMQLAGDRSIAPTIPAMHPFPFLSTRLYEANADCSLRLFSFSLAKYARDRPSSSTSL